MPTLKDKDNPVRSDTWYVRVHSPGLPNPQSLSQAGSPFLEFFHNAKSLSDFFSEVAAANDPSPSDNNFLLPFALGI